MKYSYTLIIFLIVKMCIFSQTIYFSNDSTSAAIKNNRLYFPFDNKGVIGDVSISPLGTDVQYDAINVIYSSGFALSGVDDKDSLWANGVMTADLVNDYLPGKVNSEPSEPINKIFAVSSSDPDFGKSWQEWKKAVEQGAYFYDGDGDGIYNPVDLNGNGIWDFNEDRPDLMYDVTLFTVYNDGVPSDQRRFKAISPLGIEIRQTVFVSHSIEELQDVVFVRYSIVSKNTSLSETYFTIYTDLDLGNHVDDLAGCDTLLNSVFGFNDGYDQIFGNNTPSLFISQIQGPPIAIDNSEDHALNNKGPFLGQDKKFGYSNLDITSNQVFFNADWYFKMPITPTELYNNAKGFFRDGNLVDPCNFESPLGHRYGIVLPDSADCVNVNPRFWFSGDPVTGSGWFLYRNANIRTLTSSGPFSLPKDEPVDIILAYVVGRGSDHINSISVARNTVGFVHNEYSKNFSSMTSVIENDNDLPSEYKLEQNYPNPFNPSTTIKFSLPERSEVKLSIYNLLGQEIEILFQGEKEAGSYEYVFENTSLSTGVYFYVLESQQVRLSRKMMLLK